MRLRSGDKRDFYYSSIRARVARLSEPQILAPSLRSPRCTCERLRVRERTRDRRINGAGVRETKDLSALEWEKEGKKIRST